MSSSLGPQKFRQTALPGVKTHVLAAGIISTLLGAIAVVYFFIWITGLWI